MIVDEPSFFLGDVVDLLDVDHRHHHELLLLQACAVLEFLGRGDHLLAARVSPVLALAAGELVRAHLVALLLRVPLALLLRLPDLEAVQLLVEGAEHGEAEQPMLADLADHVRKLIGLLVDLSGAQPADINHVIDDRTLPFLPLALALHLPLELHEIAGEVLVDPRLPCRLRVVADHLLADHEVSELLREALDGREDLGEELDLLRLVEAELGVVLV